MKEPTDMTNTSVSEPSEPISPSSDEKSTKKSISGDSGDESKPKGLSPSGNMGGVGFGSVQDENNDESDSDENSDEDGSNDKDKDNTAKNAAKAATLAQAANATAQVFFLMQMLILLRMAAQLIAATVIAAAKAFMAIVAAVAKAVVTAVMTAISTVATLLGVTAMASAIGLGGIAIIVAVAVVASVASYSANQIAVRDYLPPDDCKAKVQAVTDNASFNDDKRVTDNAKLIHSALGDEGWGLSDIQVAGALGNIEAESGLDPTKIETIYEGSFDVSSPKKQTAIKAKFLVPAANPAQASYWAANPNIKTTGIGLNQWTDINSGGDAGTRLLKFADKANGNWYDIDIQIMFMMIPYANEGYWQNDWLLGWKDDTSSINCSVCGGSHDLSDPETAIYEASAAYSHKYLGQSTHGQGPTGNRATLSDKWYMELKDWEADVDYANSLISRAEELGSIASGDAVSKAVSKCKDSRGNRMVGNVELVTHGQITEIMNLPVSYEQVKSQDIEMYIHDVATGVFFRVAPSGAFTSTYHFDWVTFDSSETAIIDSTIGRRWGGKGDRPGIFEYDGRFFFGGFHTMPHHSGKPGNNFLISTNSYDGSSKNGQPGHACFHFMESPAGVAHQWQRYIANWWERYENGDTFDEYK